MPDRLVLGAMVPCDGCTACCANDLLILHPEMGDDPAAYDTMSVIHPLTGEPALALKHKPDGGCVYLEKGLGCTIHGRAPAICRAFDCRKMYLRTPRAERRQLISRGLFGKDVFAAGRARVSTLGT